MADPVLPTTDPVLGATRAMLENTYRFVALADETRRMLLKTQLKGVEDHLDTMQKTLRRFADAADWAAVQAAQAQVVSDQAQLQAELSRAYGKVFADAASAWFDQCRECGNDWTQRAQAANGAGNGEAAGIFGPLSTSLAEFYDRIGKMTPPFGTVPPAETPASPRARTH
ncbi:MAG: hypothetical protein JO278_09810 [Dyella sp.]|nr:hypothetical protein [Dyella sp.]MBV8271273.1 hypothetical protein [Cupriavidus sp.]